MSRIIRSGRALCAELHWITGTRATGAATLRATGSDVSLLAKVPVFLVPKINGALRPEIIFRTVGDATIVAAGTSVPIKALSGGAMYNLPAGAELVLLPPEPGIQPLATTTAGTSGGVAATGWGVAAQVRLLEDVRAGQVALDLFTSKTGLYPCVAFAWSGDRRFTEGVRVPNKQVRLYWRRWACYVIASRVDNEDTRRLEAMDIIDNTGDSIDGKMKTEWMEPISAHPDGVQTEKRRRIQVKNAPNALVYALDLLHVAAVDMVRTRTAVINPWLESRVDMVTDRLPGEVHADDPLEVVIDNEVDHEPPT